MPSVEHFVLALKESHPVYELMAVAFNSVASEHSRSLHDPEVPKAVHLQVPSVPFVSQAIWAT